MRFVIFILMFTFGLCWGTCPDMCSCLNYPRDNLPENYLYYTSVTCSGYSDNSSLTLENTTSTIEIKNLSAEHFNDFVNTLVEQELEYLIVLSIKYSTELSNVSLVFDGLESLKQLSLTHNNLEEIPEIFSNGTNYNLTTINLSNNKVHTVNHNSFRTLRNLEVLNLSDNRIHSINFTHLSELKHLDMSRNLLANLSDNVLLPLTSLHYLNLSQNNLTTLNELCFRNLILLQQLDVSWNKLTKLAPGSLQLPSLARLLLAGNPHLGESREVLASTGGKLQTVDASKTGLKQVPEALTQSIRSLRLAGNLIQSVACGDLDSYPLLQFLDLTSNEISNVEDDALGRLESLSVVYFTNNKIRGVPKSLPDRLSVLHLQNNNITKVSRDDLLGLGDLEVLLLNDNNIKIVESGSFAHLPALATLDLSRNPIIALPPGSLTGPTALQVLRLSSIGSVSPARDVMFPLSTPEYLISLDLSASVGLARQLLADDAVLAASRELQELDISNTNVQVLRSDLLHYLPSLRVLHLKENRLNCSDLYWLAAWMRRQNQQEYRDVVCSSPSELCGVSVVELQQNDLSVINQDKVYNGKSINFLSKTAKRRKQTDIAAPTVSSRTMDNAFYTLSGLSNVTEAVSTNNITNSRVREQDKLDAGRQVVYNEVYDKHKYNTRENKTYLLKKILNIDKFESRKTVAINNFSSGTNKFNNGREMQVSGKFNFVTTSTHDIISSDANHKQDRLLSGKNARNATGSHSLNATTVDRISRHETLTIDSNMTENSSQWNASTGEMSMYTNSDEPKIELFHPGMIILVACALSATAILAVLATRYNYSNKKRRENFYQEDIEVNSIPSISELW